MEYPWYILEYGNGTVQRKKLVPQKVFDHYTQLLRGASKKRVNAIGREMKQDIGENHSYFTTESLLASAIDTGYYDVIIGDSKHRIFVNLRLDE